MPGYLAIVLHAHLPYVRHPEHERSLEERWLYEAILESYLPIVDLLDRLTRDKVPTPLTISLSPTLVSMLRDELLMKRFEAHLERLEALAAREDARARHHPELATLTRFYVDWLARIRGVYMRIGRDIVGALALHRDMGRIDLLTTAATHAYLPALATSPASVRAQLRLGLRVFSRIVGGRSLGLWLPECAYDPRFEDDLGRAGVRFVVVDGHGLELAVPRPPLGSFAPALSPRAVAFFGRDREATHEVWSRDAGFPGHPDYREFYRDIGFEREEQELAGEIGPGGLRIMTGLKHHRVTGRGPDKDLYVPGAAIERARGHAAHFVAARHARLRALADHGRALPAPPLIVAPYDAELFGHWWFEGPAFLEQVLRLLQRGDQTVEPTTLSSYLERHPELVVTRPAASSWGEGGFGEAWTSAEVAPIWRHVHHAERSVIDALAARRQATGISGRALDQAIVELLLLQASDWPFMIRRREVLEYATTRLREHAGAVARLTALALTAEPAGDDVAYLETIESRRPLFAELCGRALRDAFDPWP